MLMDMMKVRRMRMIMHNRLMRMSMTVCTYRYQSMDVGVVSVIMSMGVFMRQRLMLVLMFMPFCDVQHDTGQH